MAEAGSMPPPILPLKNTARLSSSQDAVNQVNAVSTPRRRLRAALQLEKEISEQLESEGWTTIKRAGKKIGDIYTLVSVCYKAPDVRFTVLAFAAPLLFFSYYTSLVDIRN